MKNILSYRRPLLGKEIKEWIAYHTTTARTEYTPIAAQMKRFDNIADERLYRIEMYPRRSWHGKEHKYKPNVIRVDKDQNT